MKRIKPKPITAIRIKRGLTVAGLKVGQSGYFTVFYTTTGKPFLFARDDQDELKDTKITRGKNGYYGFTTVKPRRSQFTGYDEITSNMIPIVSKAKATAKR
jgi:hypothetical protein